MTRNLLTATMSRVALKQTFSTGGRLIDRKEDKVIRRNDGEKRKQNLMPGKELEDDMAALEISMLKIL